MTKLEDGLPPEEVVELLRSRGPERLPSGYFDFHARKFEECVQNDPAAFSRLAPQIMELSPRYVRAFFDGIAIGQKPGIDWEQVLSLCENIMTPANQSGSQYYDVFLSIARVIHEGLRTDSIKFRFKDRVWNMAVSMAGMKDPNPSMEESYPDSYWDSFTISLNTLNGVAFLTVLHYAAWCNDHRDETFLPKVKRLISDYLEGGKATVSRHAVLGYFLPALYNIDRKWISSELYRLFNSGSEPLSKSVLDGFFSNKLNRNVFEDIIDKCGAFIQKLNIFDPGYDQLDKADMAIIDGIARAHLHGFRGARELSDGLVLRSNRSVLSHYAVAVGEILKQEDVESDKSFDADAFRRLWKNSRLTCNDELCTWVQYSPLDRKETLELLCNSVEKSADVKSFPVHELEPYAKTHPEMTSRYLDLLVQKRGGDLGSDSVSGIKDLREILCKNPGVKL